MADLLERAGLAATRALSIFGLMALLVLALMTLADGTLRWLVNRPITGVRDVGALVIAVVVSCCLPVALMERSNITIRVLPSLFGERVGALFDALAACAVTAVMVLLAWQFTTYAGNIARAGETTWILKIPTAPFWYGVAVLLWCAVVLQGIVLVLEFARLFGRTKSGHPGGPLAA